MLADLWFVVSRAFGVSPGATILLIAVSTIGGTVAAATAWLIRQVLNALAGKEPETVLPWVLSAAALGVASALLPQVRRIASQTVARRLAAALKDQLSRTVNSWGGIARFETPDWLDRLRLAQDATETGFSPLLGSLLGVGQSGITAITFVLALAVISVPLACVILATSLPGTLIQLRLSRRRTGLVRRLSAVQRRQEFFRDLQTDARAAKEVRVFGLGDFLRKRMLTEIDRNNRAQAHYDFVGFASQAVIALLASVISGLALLWTCARVAAGELPIGDVEVLIMAVIGLQAGVAAVIVSVAAGSQSLDLVHHYREVLLTPSDLSSPDQRRELTPLRDGLELRHVWFRYGPDQQWALQDISLTIPRGKVVALIGLNGAGKTTVAKLLCRLYDPDRGSVTWDGLDIRAVAPESLRDRIGVVFQDYMTYALTAAENVGVGDLSRAEDRGAVRSAASDAGIDELLAGLPSQYETMLSRSFRDADGRNSGVSGTALSGGEWQRVAIARGFMRKDRDLLILDEAGAGLDPVAEAAVHEHLMDLRHGRTCVLIAHRLASVRSADIIYVLEGGRVAEAGSHRELMSRQGEYWRLFLLQAEGYVDGVRPAAVFHGGAVDERFGPPR
jgi:ATP-binding cassette subfamily B protein